MASKRDLIRWFIKEVGWATPRNVSYFMEGRWNEALNRVYSSELSEMLREKDSSLRLRVVRNQDGKKAYTMTAKALPTFLFNHDVCVRDVVGKFLHLKGLLEVRFLRPADACILHYWFELDNGHMDDKQLERKILDHYASKHGQIVFIMRHREFPRLEAGRVEKIFNLARSIFPNKPNKILVAGYSQFLKDGKLYNQKGIEIDYLYGQKGLNLN